MLEAWKDNLLESIKSIEEAQQDNMIDTEKRNELNEVMVRLQEIMED